MHFADFAKCLPSALASARNRVVGSGPDEMRSTLLKQFFPSLSPELLCWSVMWV
jgi:hypothetical protein